MRSILLILLAIIPLAATTTITVDGVTATQANLRYVTDQAGNCTHRASEGAVIDTLIDDINGTLFPGANSDSRSGSIINGKTHTFILGTRTAEKASDNKLHSRALQNNTLHTEEVTCGSDIVTISFRTANPPIGNTTAESFPYNSNGLGNYAWPTIDFEDLTKTYVEPTTGTLLRLFTTGGYNSPAIAVSAGAALKAYEVSTADWTTASNGAVIDGAFASNSTTNAPLFLRFGPFCASININNGSTGCEYSWQVGLDSQSIGIDDFRVNVTGNGNGATIATEIALTSNGVDPQGGYNAITLPASNGSVSFPASGYPHHSLQGWVANSTTPALALQNFSSPIAAQFDGTVTANGTAVTVTLAHGGSIPLTWTNGSKVSIAGSSGVCTNNECTLAAAPTDASHLVLSQNLGSYTGMVTTLNGAITAGATSFIATSTTGFIQVAANLQGTAAMQWTGLVEAERFFCPTKAVNTFSGCVVSLGGDNYGPFQSNHANGAAVTSTDFWANNVGVLIRRPGAGTLRVDGITWEATTSRDYKMPADGIYELCSSTVVTDSSSVSGYLCDINSGLYGTLWFIPTDPFANAPRYLGQLHFNGFGAGVDATNAVDCRLDSSAYDPTDPNSFYCATSYVNNGRIAIIKATYNSAGGIGGCSVTADYQALPFNGANWPNNCLITLTNVTLQSTSRDPVSQALAFDSEFNTAFGAGAVHGAQNGMLLVEWTPQQDAMAWFGWIDPAASYNLVSLTNSYSKGTAGQRYCGDHNITPFGNTNTVFWVQQFLFDSTNFGFGPYKVKVSTTIPNSAGVTCVGITNPYVLSQIASGQGCTTIQLDRATPCRYNPSTYETANYPDCAADPGVGARQLPVAGAPLQEGDVIKDEAGTTEYIMLAKSLGGNSWRVLRNWLPFIGPFLTSQDVFSGIQTHTATWTADATCNSMTFGGGAGAFNQLDAHGSIQKNDWAFTPTGHADIQNGLFMAAGYAYRTGWPTTIGRAVTFPSGANQAGGTIFSNGSFSGNRGNGLYNNYDFGVGSNNAVGSHLSLSRNPLDPFWFLDGNAYENGSGAGYGLWTQTGVTSVSGTLYKLPKTNVVYQTNYPASLKTHPFSVFAGKYLLKIIGGPGSTIDGTSTFNYVGCVVNIADECVAGSAQGDVYINIPQMGVASLASFTCAAVLWNNNTLCATPLGPENGYVNQVMFPKNQTGIFGNATMRHITSGFGRYGSQYVFHNARGSANSKFFITDTPWLDGYRTVLLIGKLPPIPGNDSLSRFVHTNVTISLGAASGYPKAYIRFGYAENGSPISYYCSPNRQEECRTSSAPTTTNPYWWSSDSAKTYADVSGGTLTLPVISGRTVYYQIVRCIDNTCAVPNLGLRGAISIP